MTQEMLPVKKIFMGQQTSDKSESSALHLLTLALLLLLLLLLSMHFYMSSCAINFYSNDVWKAVQGCKKNHFKKWTLKHKITQTQ